MKFVGSAFLNLWFFAPIWAFNSESVRGKLLDNYDAKIPPPTPNEVPINISVALVVNYFTLDVEEHVFIVNAWMQMSWTDTRLVYNASSMSDMVLRFGTEEIWKPDLTLYNNAYPTEVDHYGDTHLLVASNGSVLWVPPTRAAAHCTLNMIMWPFDKHTCQLKFGSWTHHGKELDLVYVPQSNETTKNGDYLLRHTNYIENSEWSLLESSAARNAMFYSWNMLRLICPRFRCCPEPYIDLTFSFTVQRNSPSYIAVFVVPVVLIAIVNMLTMLLPPTSGEKLMLGAMQFFLLCIFLLYIQAKVPALGDHLPLLVVLYICNLALVTMSLIISVVVINLARARTASSPPQCCRVLCNVQFTRILGLGYLLPFVPKTSHRRLGAMRSTGSTTAQHSPGRWEAELNGLSLEAETSPEEDSANLVDIDASRPMANAEWILIASMIDRVAFIVFLFTNFVLLLACLC